MVLLGLPQAVLAFDARMRLLLWNSRASALLGLPDHQPSRPPPMRSVLQEAQGIDEVGRETLLTRCRDAVATVGEDTAEIGTIRLGAQDVAVRISAIGPGQFIAMLEQAGPAVPAPEEALIYQDPLTGMGNRREFTRVLTRLLDRRPAGVGGPAILLLDLDRFKHVNDSLGHPVGDALLRLVGHRIRQVTREEDSAARLGGDEFAIVLQEETGAALLAERLVDVLSRPYVVQGNVANIGASIGVAVAPAGGVTTDELVRSADLALYDAKEAGRGVWRLFEPRMDERARARRELENDLRKAIVLKQFELHYQPQVNLTQDRLAGFEALVRWRHPERGLVPPIDFIPLAEEIGLIADIGDWVLHAACAEAATWPGELTVAVNVAPRQLDDGQRLLRAVERALTQSGLSATRLEVEITESALMRREADVLDLLHTLRNRGVRVSMDDFGTGYSSLSQLRSFPFDKIKIDRVFVKDLSPGGEALAVVRAIAALGASLGMTTTAEGVETEEQADLIRGEGCTSIQGYLISRPVPANEVAQVIQRQTGGTISTAMPPRTAVPG